jgi:hypothetical protein
MPETFFIRSPAGVPWYFTDRYSVMVGDAPGMIARAVFTEDHGYRISLTSSGGRPLSAGHRNGAASAVAFILQAGDTWACLHASRPASDKPLQAAS